jgi:hypothetical protein
MLKRLLPLVPLIFFIACGSQAGEIGPSVLTAVALTQTAMLWTPTPSLTPEPQTGKVIDAINEVLINSDPLAETIGARYRVLDLQVFPDPPDTLSRVLQIVMECEWVYTDSCTPEEAFITLMNAFKTSDKVKQQLSANIPDTVTKLQLASYNSMHVEGIIVIPWKDVCDYMEDSINGNQLGIRINRTPLP